MDQKTVDQFAESVKAELGLHSFSLSLRNNGDLYLGMLAVPKETRKQGVGSQAMERLTAFADANGMRLVLTTGLRDDKWGTTSQSRLLTFYKRFGFVHNSGRNKDFAISENMYRDPKMKKQTFREFYNRNLLETPIGDYQTIGDWSKNSSFRDKRDRMLIQHPRSIEMVRKKFGNTEHTFHFFFVNSKEGNKVTEEGIVKPEWVKEHLGEEVFNAVSKNMGDDAINVVFTNNKGAERKNMSAWIMAHRIGHALARENGSRRSHAYRECSDHLISQFAACMQYYGKDSFPDSERHLTNRGYDEHSAQKSRRDQLTLLSLFYEVGSFKSARDRNIRDWFEVLNELIAQYLTTGKIKFRPAPKSFGQKGPKGFMHYSQETQDVDDILDTLGRDMAYYIDNMLGGVSNGVLVM